MTKKANQEAKKHLHKGGQKINPNLPVKHSKDKQPKPDPIPITMTNPKIIKDRE